MRRAHWPLRLALLALVVAAVYPVSAWADMDPHLLPLLLVALLALAVVWAVTDVLADSTPDWEVPFEDVGRVGFRDARLAAYVRTIDSNRTARTPDTGLRDRVAALAASRLRIRHGLGVSDPQARDLLTPELADFLAAPARRVSLTELDRYLSVIEEL